MFSHCNNRANNQNQRKKLLWNFSILFLCTPLFQLRLQHIFVKAILKCYRNELQLFSTLYTQQKILPRVRGTFLIRCVNCSRGNFSTDTCLSGLVRNCKVSRTVIEESTYAIKLFSDPPSLITLKK